MLENNLKTYRSEKKLTQQELADILEVNRQTIIAIESGRYRPSVELALMIARFFRVTVEQVFILKD
jgi:putative transcriptional regulator